MAAASYYDVANTQEEKSQIAPSQGLQSGLSQEHAQAGGDQRGFQQQGYNGQYAQQAPHGPGEGGYGGQQQQYGGQQQQQMGQQQMNTGNYGQGGGQQINGAGGQAAVVDDRDTMTKWLDRIEKKFGGDRFNNPENAEKNRKLNENILKRLKQVGMLVIQRAPRMLMNMAR